jgi:hypothetical protein
VTSHGQRPTTPGHADPELHGSPSVVHAVHGDPCPASFKSHPQAPRVAFSHVSDDRPVHVSGDTRQHSPASLFVELPASSSFGAGETPPHAAKSTKVKTNRFMVSDRSTSAERSR